MDIQITNGDCERWVGQLYIRCKQLEKALMMIDKEDKKGVEVVDDKDT